MKFKVCNEETNNQEIVVEKNVWTGKTDLFISNKKAIKLGRNKFLYKDEDTEEEYRLKGNEIFGIELLTNGRKITVLRKLNIFEIILSLIPVALIVIGGAIGGACAGAGIYLIAANCRKFENIFIKILFAIGVYLDITLIWFVIASYVLVLFPDK